MAENTSPRPKQQGSGSYDKTYGHMQPQALDLEKLVLGALMIDQDAFSMISETIRPETFYEPRHQKVYNAIQTLNIDEKPVDIATVVEELKREGTLEEVGGAPYITELSAHVASSAHIVYHAQILSQKYMARQLISFAGNVESKAFDETVDVNELMQETEGRLFELSQRNMKKDYVQVAPVVKKALEILKKASADSSGITGVATGYTDLDAKTSGWQKSDLVIIAGRPAMGKTSFALSLAKNIAVDNGVPIAFFSLEMNNVQLVNRLISNVCEVKGEKMLNGQLTPDEWDRLDKNLRALQDAPLYIDDTAGLSIFELRTKARRLVREKNVQVIMIDYLQLMNANGMKFGNRQEEVSKISQSLKGLAKELDIPVLALSQLSRNVTNREGIEGKRPQLSDLRESGAIEQDADMVLFVHRPEYYRIFQDEKGNDLHGKAQIIIAKHRKGATGDVLMEFRGEYTRFEDVEKSAFASRELAGDGGEFISSKIDGSGMPSDVFSDDSMLADDMSEPIF